MLNNALQAESNAARLGAARSLAIIVSQRDDELEPIVAVDGRVYIFGCLPRLICAPAQ